MDDCNNVKFCFAELPGLIEAVQRAEPEPIQFGPNAGKLAEGQLDIFRKAQREFIALAQKALEIRNQTYLDAVGEKLHNCLTQVYWIPAG